MSADLVDPFATHEPREHLKTSDMRKDINARIALSSQNDPPLCPQLVRKTLDELAQAAEGSDPALDATPVEVWARWLLEQLHHRAVTGIPYDEAAEPAWSLDSERRMPR